MLHSMTTASSFDRSRKWPKNTKLDSHCYCVTTKCIQHIGCTSEELNLVNCTHVLHSRDLHFQVEVLKNCNEPNILLTQNLRTAHDHLSATPAVLTIFRPMLEIQKPTSLQIKKNVSNQLLVYEKSRYLKKGTLYASKDKCLHTWLKCTPWVPTKIL